jgi:hypothetical protein
MVDPFMLNVELQTVGVLLPPHDEVDAEQVDGGHAVGQQLGERPGGQSGRPVASA